MAPDGQLSYEWILGIAPNMSVDERSMSAVVLHTACVSYEYLRLHNTFLDCNATKRRLYARIRLDRQKNRFVRSVFDSFRP